MTRDDDQAWRAIVDNFGERAHLDPEFDPELNPEFNLGADDVAAPEPDLDEPEELYDVDRDEDEGFVPPEPPPIPTPSTDRLLAWAGVLGAPLVLLGFLLLQVRLSELLTLGLVASFVGGFCYLVFKMPREPRDDWDDGAVL